MEGVSGEASSLAGFLGLGKLCLIYDDNHITIEGSTGLAFGEDVGKRYEAYGFHVQKLDDGWSTDDLRAALDAADAEDGAAVADHRAHAHRDRRAARAGHAGVARRAARRGGGPPHQAGLRLGSRQARSTCPTRSTRTARSASAAPPITPPGTRCTPRNWRPIPTRVGRVRPRARGRAPGRLGGRAPRLLGRGRAGDARRARAPASRRSPAAIPELIGGSADLAPSNNSTIKGDEAIAGAPLANKENAQADSVLPGRMGGRTLHFGIREHGMGAILNGLVVHGGFRAFGATFFVFSDYMRPAVRLAASWSLPVIYVWTHDSVGLGEDGPTHQPIEHLASLRAMPHMRVIRPADATETAEAWRLALERTTGRSASRSRARSCPCSTAPSSRPRAACGAAATCWPTPTARPT